MSTHRWEPGGVMALVARGVEQVARWEQTREPHARWADETDYSGMAAVLELLLSRLLPSSPPTFHPDYAGHMGRPPHPIAWAADAITSLLNPNNQSREASPVTTDLEIEVIEQLIAMCGLPASTALGHLTSSGTIANLEALWIARELAPGRPVALGTSAHYNHRRAASILSMPVVELPQDEAGRIDLQLAERLLARERPALIVVTLGTTGRGALDPLHDLLPIARRYDVRVHVDAAWGGFYALVAARRDGALDPAPWLAMAQADSITIDPHKHGLQPYGCGCILYRDQREVRPILAHDSPYTYLDTQQLHMGQIQLECSRGGAAAAALWATLRHVPLSPERGLGPRLAASRRAALAWHQALERCDWARPLATPDLDILTFGICDDQRPTASGLTSRTLALINRLRTSPSAPQLVQLWLSVEQVARCWPDLIIDAPRVALIRACIMKPEHEQRWPALHDKLAKIAKELS